MTLIEAHKRHLWASDTTDYVIDFKAPFPPWLAHDQNEVLSHECPLSSPSFVLISREVTLLIRLCALVARAILIVNSYSSQKDDDGLKRC